MGRTAYVVEAYAPYGGTYMAYHVARILHVDFGYGVRVVTSIPEPIDSAEESLFHYDHRFPRVSPTDCEGLIGDDDVLICNPSFSSQQLGLRSRGLKIMYAQGFTTFNALDCFFDHYFAVSGFVQNFLSQTYGISAPVIPAFLVDLEGLLPPTLPVDAAAAWEARPPFSLALNMKGDPVQQMLLLSRLRSELKAKDLALEASIDWDNALERGREKVPRRRLLERLASVRYLLTLSLTEGFGLVPLEAMSMGAVVLGFDGFGGREYMVPGTNCAVAACPDVALAADALIRVMRDDLFAKRLATLGVQTASAYSYESFHRRWVDAFNQILPRVSRLHDARADTSDSGTHPQ